MHFIFDGKFEANITNTRYAVTNIFPKQYLDSFTLIPFSLLTSLLIPYWLIYLSVFKKYRT